MKHLWKRMIDSFIRFQRLKKSFILHKMKGLYHTKINFSFNSLFKNVQVLLKCQELHKDVFNCCQATLFPYYFAKNLFSWKHFTFSFVFLQKRFYLCQANNTCKTNTSFWQIFAKFNKANRMTKKQFCSTKFWKHFKLKRWPLQILYCFIFKGISKRYLLITKQVWRSTILSSTIILILFDNWRMVRLG